MDKQALINELKSIIEAHLKNESIDLVDLIYRYEGSGLVLRLLVDRPEGGITIEECARINREISRILDERAILSGYLLEVSSPGLGRPLKTKADFLRCINRAARIFLKEPIDGKWEIEGSINKVTDNSIFIEAGACIIEAPLAKISKGKQLLT